MGKASKSHESETTEQSTESKHDARLEKLKKLREKMEESQEANRQEVFAEHRRKSENPKDAIRRERKRKEAEELLLEKNAEEQGADAERLRGLNYTAEEVELWEQKQEEKRIRQKPDLDFSDMAARKYNKLVNQIKPNHVEYEKRKQEAEAKGQDFYGDVNSLDYGSKDGKPSEEVVEAVVKSVHEQIHNREHYSRRRKHREDDDVTYINDRNMRFNKKLGRAYDQYTADIKANLERGTAL